MNSKIAVPIAIIVTVIVTALVTSGIIFSIQVDEPSTISQPTIPKINEPSTISNTINTDIVGSEIFKGTNEIKKISSQDELAAILEASPSHPTKHRDTRAFTGEILTDAMPFESTTRAESASVQFDSKSSGGSDYSTTNIQVENVDEPDYLKNDSKYVYIVSKNTLSIIDAYPAESAELILKIALDIESQYIQNMFLNGDRLVIFYNGHVNDEIIPQFDFIPVQSSRSVTHALIIDVSDKKNPSIVNDYSIDGHFMDARMIGDHTYFVTNIYLDYQNPRLPIITDDSDRIIMPDTFYFDSLEPFSNFNTLTAIDIFGDKINSESFLMGYSGAFYVSQNNFYLTYLQSAPFELYRDSPQDEFFNVIVPLLPNNIQEQIKAIQNDSSTPTTQWTKISELLQQFYNKMNKDDKDDLFDEITKALAEYSVEVRDNTSKTIIHKISIDDEKINYITKGAVPGRLLNQFSMDENNDRFRIATTIDHHSNQGAIRSNAVYVLDEQLNIVGKLEKIAVNESIFSARFMGDRLYLVTFQQVDPFFVIDLSADTPKILGELKIPGFSDYLHPYDEDYIIGIGRDTKIDNNRAIPLGVKIALFNVKDVANPTVADDIIIGLDSSTFSEARYNHKAFFFDKKSGILSIPITGKAQDLDVNPISAISKSDFDYWAGFYIFDIDKTKGISIKGTIEHSTGGSIYDLGQFARTFYIDDVLYTASEGYLKMNNFNNLDKINSIKLQNTGKFVNYLDEAQ